MQNKLSSRKKENMAAYMYLAPWLLGIALFYMYPFIRSLVLSFTDADFVSASPVGLDNYIEMFTDDSRFMKSLLVTSRYAFIGVPLRLVFALILALIFQKGSTFYRTVFYLPSLIGSSVAVAVMWKQLFGLKGLISGLAKIVGVTPVNWIGHPRYALWILIVLAVWQFGSAMVIFIAGLKNIPRSLYEAAKVDGANKVYTFFRITVPMLSPVILFNLILQLIGGFQVFTQGFVITKGGPMDSTLFTVHYIYQEAFKLMRIGYASAISWVLFIVIAVITALIFLSSKYWVYYES